MTPPAERPPEVVEHRFDAPRPPYTPTVTVQLTGRRTERRWTGFIALVVLAVLVAGAGWWQNRPYDPPGARPLINRSVLSDEHGCQIPRLWQPEDPLVGALVVSVDPDKPARVAWVPAADVAHWQPHWQIREWCVR